MNASKYLSIQSAARKLPMVVWQALLGLALIGAWETLATTGALDRFFFSRPSDILARVAQWLVSGSIWANLAVTLEEAFFHLYWA